MDRMALRTEEKNALKTKLNNPNITDCTEAFLGIVKDKKKGTLFYEYEDKSKIAERIYAELLDKYIDEAGFILSDDFEKIGILSQAQGASSLDTLINKMDLFRALSKMEALQLKEIYENTIRDIITKVQRDENSFIFNATPFDINCFNKDYAFTETVTWVVSAFLGALQLNGTSFEIKKGSPVSISFNKEEIETITGIISWCIKFLTDSFIDISESNHDNKLSKGWNFTNDCREPSLYFTYAVSECYMDIYDTFKEIIDWRSISEKIEKIKDKASEYSRLSYTNTDKEDWFWQYISPEDRDTYEGIKEIVTSSNFKNKERIFNTINADAKYYTLDEQVKKTSESIWDIVKDRIDSNFFNYNLSSVITTEAIESSSTSDAPFNTIFAISIVIAGGIDEDIKDRIAAETKDDQIAKLQGDYDNLLETLQTALQRTIRYNKILRTKRKDYIVNDFIISCNEAFDGETNLKAQELRKKRIKAFTLSPLLMKANNLISEYLTQYPQIDMVKFLDELLMRKRTKLEGDDNESQYIWIWENGEYLITSNYFYILSLSSFYEYAEKYEDRFSRIEIENEKVKEQLIKTHDLESRNNGEIYKLTQEKNYLADDNAELKNRIQYLENSGVESELRKFMQQELKSNIMGLLTDCLHEINEEVAGSLMKEDFNSRHNKQIGLLQELKRALVASFFEAIRFRLQFFDVQDTKTAVKLISEKLQTEAEKLMNEQIKAIIEAPDFGSKLKGEHHV